MTAFIPYIRDRLVQNGYQITVEKGADLILRSPDDDPVWVQYHDTEIPVDFIRKSFDFKGHVLFVLHEHLIPDAITDRESTPYWLRVLHGLYMGRIYVWNDRTLYAVHFDYDEGDILESSIIQPDGLLLVETGTWLRGWNDAYKLARFWDVAWWTDTNQQREQAREQRQNFWEQYQQQEQERQRQREQERQRQYAYTAPPPKQNGSQRDFLREFLNCGTLAKAKGMYRDLAKEFHPDLNPGRNTTVTMQQVNAAWDKAREMLR